MRFALVFFLLVGITSFAQDLEIQVSHTKADLRGVSAVSDTVAWASGTHGTFLRTTDGGHSWAVAQVPGAESLDFRDVEAFSENVAYLLAAGPGSQSAIFKTIDGGKHWTAQLKNEDPRGFYDCMAFWDENHGILLGDAIWGEFQLFATSDGEHWSQLPTQKLPTSLEGESAFAASGTCITVQGDSNVWFGTGGKAARVFRSSDRGQTWQVSETPVIHGSESTGIFSITFRDADRGVAAGGDYREPSQGGPNVAFTMDGGQSWTLSSLTPQHYFSAASFTSAGLLLAGTSGAGLAQADASGSEPSRFLHAWPMNINAISASKDGTAFAVGPKGFIARIRAPKHSQ